MFRSDDFSEGWHCSGISITGASHEAKGVCCQDSLFYLTTDNALYFAVADGAGSATHSNIGSRLAVRAICRKFKSIASSPEVSFGDDGLKPVESAFLFVRRWLNHYAKRMALDPSSLATTLLFVAVFRESVLVAQVGDGLIVGDFGDGPELLIDTPRYEYSNMTNFITDPDFEENACYSFHDRKLSRLALVTDGIEASARKTQNQEIVPEFFNPIFRFVEKTESVSTRDQTLLNFLHGKKISQASGDDKTLLVACERKEVIP